MRPFEIKPLEPIKSLADALAAVQAVGALRGRETARLRATGVVLPNGRRTGFVVMHGPEVEGVAEWWLPMPSSAGFCAQAGSGRAEYPISMLDGATVRADGRIELTSGEQLTAIDFITAPGHYEVGSRDGAIVLLVVAFLGKLDECYPEIYGELFSGPRALRYDKIAQLRVRDLKIIRHYVNQRLRKPVSRSVLSKALAAAGMQMPRPRRTH